MPQSKSDDKKPFNNRNQQNHNIQQAKRNRKPEKRLLGIISTTGKGTGFVSIDELEEDVLIFPEFVNTAMNGDEVEIILQPKIPNERQTGQVVKIIQRAKKEFVGTIQTEKNVHYLIPDDKKMYTSIVISNESMEGQHDNEKALVKITSWQKNEQHPHGDVVKILGQKGSHNVEMESIILDRGIDTDFPEDVEREAESLEKNEKPLRNEEISKRKDFRDSITFTIDPIDAKDFDDALSVKKVGEHTYEIGVHIADVSYYVREGSFLDKEAQKRATSIYLVDRTIPMLPEVLSNDLCSLRPHEDRFAFSAVFTMNRNGDVLEKWFGKTVINSNMRFSYETAQEVLNVRSGDYFDELYILNSIGKKLREEKFKKGAIDFEQDEVKFKLDEKGTPVSVYRKERLDTHKLVEEFMLLANREVAEFIYNSQKAKKEGVSIYRIHDLPDKERITELSIFLHALGHDLPLSDGKVSSKDINVLLKSIEGLPEESLIKTATIRSMAKAIYSPKNIGHFGLGFKFYTHFTSPIRRYPDLIVHRILHHLLLGNQKKVANEFAFYERISRHSTEREIAAAEAERASIKYKQVEYMSKHIGEEFEGIISGVTEWGIYVEDSQTKCEGMVRLRNLTDDYYLFNSKTYSIQGEKRKKKYTLGDKVRFRVLHADLDAKTLDYAMLS